MEMTLFAFQTPDGLFWDGNAPYSGERAQNWNPVFKKMPVSMGREITMQRKLVRYRAIKKARPMALFPEITPVRVQVVMAVEPMLDLDTRSVAAAYHLIDALRLKDTPEGLIEDVETFYHRIGNRTYVAPRVDKAKWKRNDPQTLWGKKVMFMSEDAAVLFRIAHPNELLIDLKPYLPPDE